MNREQKQDAVVTLGVVALAPWHGVHPIVPRSFAGSICIQMAALIHEQLQNSIRFAVGPKKKLPQALLIHVRHAAHVRAAVTVARRVCGDDARAGSVGMFACNKSSYAALQFLGVASARPLFDCMVMVDAGTRAVCVRMNDSMMLALLSTFTKCYNFIDNNSDRMPLTDGPLLCMMPLPSAFSLQIQRNGRQYLRARCHNFTAMRTVDDAMILQQVLRAARLQSTTYLMRMVSGMWHLSSPAKQTRLMRSSSSDNFALDSP